MTGDKTKVTFHTKNPKWIRLFKEMVKENLAYECPENHFRIVYSLDEWAALGCVTE